jgi:hypothetical protein
MSAHDAQPYAAFRLNLEQQQKRAKDLLKAAKAGEKDAQRRLQRAGFTKTFAFNLAQAQHCLARELRFANWAALKRHVAAMAKTRTTLGDIVDDDCRTMHIRCGNDIQNTLREAGLRGDFNLHINPYLQGPVTEASDWLEQRARYIAERFGPHLDLEYGKVLAEARAEETRLAEASCDYERVVLWFEHDRYDQFVLLRCLAWFAEHGSPPRLELVGPNDFPGATRFVGLGQLPPEALRLLWQRRQPVGAGQLAVGQRAWNLFRSADPRPLAALVRDGVPLLPDLKAAPRRHLQELPAVANGLGLTQELLLRALADHGGGRAGRIVGLVMHERDPLPGLGDIGYDQVLREMAALAEPLVVRAGAQSPREWHRDEVAITALGRAVLTGERDCLSLPVPERWVGGVRIATGQRNWRWDDRTDAVVSQ